LFIDGDQMLDSILFTTKKPTMVADS